MHQSMKMVTNEMTYGWNATSYATFESVQVRPGEYLEMGNLRGSGGWGNFTADVYRAGYEMRNVQGRRFYNGPPYFSTYGVYDIVGEYATVKGDGSVEIGMAIRYRDRYGHLFDVWHQRTWTGSKTFGTTTLVANPVGPQIFIKEPCVRVKLGTPGYEISVGRGGLGLKVLDGNMNVFGPLLYCDNMDPQVNTIGIGPMGTPSYQTHRGGFQFNAGGAWRQLLIGYGPWGFDAENSGWQNGTLPATPGWVTTAEPRGGPWEVSQIQEIVAGEFNEVRAPILGKRSISVENAEQIIATDLPYNVNTGNAQTGMQVTQLKNSRQIKWEVARFPLIPSVHVNLASWAASIFDQDLAWRYRALNNGDTFALNLSLNN
jgi:hypothetical protein